MNNNFSVAGITDIVALIIVIIAITNEGLVIDNGNSMDRYQNNGYNGRNNGNQNNGYNENYALGGFNGGSNNGDTRNNYQLAINGKNVNYCV